MSTITYSRTTIFGAITADAINDIIKVKATVVRLKAAMDSVSAGGATPANLEGGNWGVAAGQGSAFYTNLANLNSNLAAITAAVLADVDLGG